MEKTFKNTLQLPQTNFPMKASLTQKEPELIEKWKKENIYFQIQKKK